MSESRLDIWKKRLAESDKEFDAERDKMDSREKLYSGVHEITAMSERDKATTAPHCRNIIFENIESMVSSSIPQPKVTPRCEGDEKLADIIERFLRNELDRLPFEEINDMAERTVPIQGGVGFLIDWDNSARTHSTVGEVTVSEIHPKQFGPQPKVYTSVADMDWFIVKLPTTKETVRRKYGVELSEEGESEPELRGTETGGTSDDAVTQYIGYERGENGGINKYSWVNETELEDLEDYQARRLPTCARCGRIKPMSGQIINSIVEKSLTEAPEEENAAAGLLMAQRMADGYMSGSDTEDGAILGDIEYAAGEPIEPVRYDGGACPWCGGTEWTEEIQEYEQVLLPMRTQSGLDIPGEYADTDENGMPVMRPTLIPFYKPDVFPIVIQKSVSVFGQLLGNSDVDMIRDQQNTTNRVETKILERLIDAGSVITLPDDATKFHIDSKEHKKYYVKDAASKSLIDMYTFSGDVSSEMVFLNQVYEEARQILGITDSYQGRTDKTATSAVAKQFAAAQSAGRLESKRVMKDAAYARIFELMFKFWLAYSDEPRPISYKDSEGKTRFEEFNRYDFLKQDEDGVYYWNDQFLFSCDSSAPLASNREAMWQETRLNLQTGAFGDPTNTETLILFWAKMEMLHYPGASETKKYLEDKLLREQQAAAMQTGDAAQSGGQAFMGGRTALGIDPRMLDEVDRIAERDAVNSLTGNDLKAERAGVRERGRY